MSRKKGTNTKQGLPLQGRSGVRLPKLSGDADPAEFFDAGMLEGESSFAELLAGGLGTDTVSEVMAEKGDNGMARTPSVQEMILLAPSPQQSLDLHGNTGAEAEIRLESFLASCRHQCLKTVLVITGRGLHSPAGPVLRQVVETRLKAMQQEGAILAFRWEKKSREQSGAVIVYLR